MNAGAVTAPPTFSIIVPVFNAAEFLAECLDSIRQQSYDRFEILAIDDASTDASPALLDSYAAQDERVRVIHLAANAGIGRARNAGLEQARALWVLFVDSDDTLAAGALQAVAERIAEAGEPDVVLFGFARRYRDGQLRADPRSASLAPPAVLRADQRPQLMEIFPAAWNKAYRAAFLTKLEISFPDGIYEDMPWSYTTLMAAAQIATLDRVCYHYRQRDGSALSAVGARQLDLFDQYDRLFGYLDAHPELDSWRCWLIDRLTRHVPTVFEAAERVPRADRRSYFHAASAAFRRHRPPDYLPSGTAGLKVRLIEQENYPAFRAAQLANRVRRRLRSRRGT